MSATESVGCTVQWQIDKLAAEPCPLDKSLLKYPLLTISAVCLVSGIDQAMAHTSEQGFVLLLPTEVYTGAGVIAVAATVIILAILPDNLTGKLFSSTSLISLPTVRFVARISSLCSLGVVLFLLATGFTGSHDPLKNLLPLTIWTVWWVGFISAQGMLGNIWHLVNPWCGLYWLVARLRFTKTSAWKLPKWCGVWPSVVVFLVFSSFAFADPAPEDPPRLAIIVTLYLMFTVTGMIFFGANTWLRQVECFTVLLERIARLSPLYFKPAHNRHTLYIGLSGWRQVAYPPATLGSAVFILTLLAVGSFDGLNETFWWLQQININPLEFPGRSAVIAPTVFGLLLSVVLLTSAFAVCTWTGTLLANNNGITKVRFLHAFVSLSGSVLPIALAYHIAHFLTSFMVNIQYTIAAATDPLQNGRDLLGLGRFYVTTGFFNSRDSAKTIWLTQAGAVVAGHILSVLMAHAIARKLWQTSRQVLLSQLPLSIFMVLYTLLGLWLLAAPRGA